MNVSIYPIVNKRHHAGPPRTATTLLELIVVITMMSGLLTGGYQLVRSVRTSADRSAERAATDQAILDLNRQFRDDVRRSTATQPADDAIMMTSQTGLNVEYRFITPSTKPNDFDRRTPVHAVVRLSGGVTDVYRIAPRYQIKFAVDADQVALNWYAADATSPDAKPVFAIRCAVE